MKIILSIYANLSMSINNDIYNLILVNEINYGINNNLDEEEGV